MTAGPKFNLLTPGLTVHLEEGKVLSGGLRDQMQYNQILHSMEFEAITRSKTRLSIDGKINCSCSFESQLLLGLNPLLWSERLRNIRLTFPSHDIKLTIPCTDKQAVSLFYWCCMSNMVIYPNGFVQTERRKNQFFAMCPEFVKLGYQQLFEYASSEGIEVTYTNPTEVTKTELLAKLLHQRMLSKLGFRLKFFADYPNLNSRKLKSQMRFEKIVFGLGSVLKVSLAREIELELNGVMEVLKK